MGRSITGHVLEDQRGQSYLEFAIILPIMMLVVMGIVDFGRVFNAWLVITHGAREGARVAAVGFDDASVEARVWAVTADTPIVDVEPEMVGGVRTEVGSPVTVTVSTSVNLLSGWIAAILGIGEVPVSAGGVVRYEGPCLECS